MITNLTILKQKKAIEILLPFFKIINVYYL